ncbi:protein DDI1 homolog 2-like [Argiope bruennichi]|uniref:Protein DDI1 like protein n=1 Tax=Argiope bruennichi TaxID=94029 RepID=A0A8T0FP41_ARGBR|nr:protein DDI1 homolog 2-like [Argiope bruennichi]KAF8792332.1 Protein DDI1 like protein [Argiope bruennichi]
MKLTVTTLTDLIVTLDVSPDMELENFKALCECEVGFPSQQMVITHEGRPLMDNKKDLSSFGVKEGDVLLIQQIFPNLPNSQSQLPDLGIDFSAIKLPNTPAPSPATPPGIPTASFSAAGASTSTPHADTAERLRQDLLNFPDRLALLKQNNPSLAEAFLSGNKEMFAEVLNRQLADKAERERKRIQMLNADPFDPEYQKLIAEEIRQDNVDSNMEAAIEYHPESFGQVTMLYINCKVNGHAVRAFIDSGAQTTIMSQACAERCGIMRLVDKRWSGYAKGVGVQKILGRVHLGHIQINDVFLQSSFSILEDQVMDMLLGLDMLKRHQCCIDLKRNVLVIGTTGTETPFLSESDLPRSMSQVCEPTELEMSRFGPRGNPDNPNKNK